MCRCFSDVDRRNQVDKEVDDKLPIVDARRIGISYAARIVDYQCYVQKTRCNKRYHRHAYLFNVMSVRAQLSYVFI